MSFSIRRGDIFYVHKFGIQVGSEEHTGRPGVVVSCDEGNRYSETVQVAFCTTQPKSNLPTHVEILSTGRASTVMCEQINTVSLERLGNYIGRCTRAGFPTVRSRFIGNRLFLRFCVSPNVLPSKSPRVNPFLRQIPQRSVLHE